MSVLIKGMELPESCSDCAARYEMFCPLRHRFIADEGRRKDCPLIKIPPHGRLIDADAQDAQIEALIERHLHGYTKSTWDFVCELRDILKRNRTVIPAEEGET